MTALTAAQTKAIQRFTRKVDQSNRFTTIDDTINGCVAWRLVPLAEGTGKFLLIGDNIDNREWFHRSLMVFATVGPRGGIKVDSIDGFSKILITN